MNDGRQEPLQFLLPSIPSLGSVRIPPNASKPGFVSAKEMLVVGSSWNSGFVGEAEAELDHSEVMELLRLEMKQQTPNTK